MNDKPVAHYQGDSKRFHRYILDPGQGITGVIYFPKEMKAVPKEITIELKIKKVKLDS